MRLPDPPILCLVTSLVRAGHLEPERSCDRLVSLIAAAAAAGVSLVQVREPSLEGGALYRLVVRLLRAVEGTSCRVVVNERLDVALAADADGVHLRGDSAPARRVRELAPGRLVGRSIHTVAEARSAAGDLAVDYLLFGSVFPTTSKPSAHPAAGVAALSDVVRAAGSVPVLAIGGITGDNACDVAAAGAAGIAGIGLFLDAGPDPRRLGALVGRLRDAFDRSGGSRR